MRAGVRANVSLVLRTMNDGSASSDDEGIDYRTVDIENEESKLYLLTLPDRRRPKQWVFCRALEARAFLSVGVAIAVHAPYMQYAMPRYAMPICIVVNTLTIVRAISLVLALGDRYKLKLPAPRAGGARARRERQASADIHLGRARHVGWTIQQRPRPLQRMASLH